MMQSKLIENSAQKYPYLGSTKNKQGKAQAVVLFTAPEIGTIIWVNKVPSSSHPAAHSVGFQSANWDESAFYKFRGRLILSNDELLE